MAEDHVNSPTEYQLMEEEITSSTEKIYILTSSPLPSHIRSVEVKHSGLISDLNSLPCSSRAVNITLILIFVFVTSLTVSIAVYKITEITDSENEMQSFYISDGNKSDEPLQLVMTTERDNTTFYEDSNVTDINPQLRRNCAHRCQVYADYKFKLDCIFGRCVCRGQNYQFSSCLPSVKDCRISKGFFPSANFSISSVPTPVYRCFSSAGNNLHILSLYGNHFARFTEVHITGESETPVTLVLANFYPVTWRILYQGIDLQQVILASQFNLASSSIETVLYVDENSTQPQSGIPEISSMPTADTTETPIHRKPKVRTLQSPVGFGNDVHNSQTVEMLKVLSDRYGPVRSFTGADYADFISLQIGV